MPTADRYRRREEKKLNEKKSKTGARQEADTIKAQNNTKTYQPTTRSNEKKQEKRNKKNAAIDYTTQIKKSAFIYKRKCVAFSLIFDFYVPAWPGQTESTERQ